MLPSLNHGRSNLIFDLNFVILRHRFANATQISLCTSHQEKLDHMKKTKRITPTHSTSRVMPHSNYELFNNWKERDCIRPAYILLRMSMFLRLGAFRARIESWVKLMSARWIGNSPHVKCFAPHHDLQEESINFRLEYKSEKMTHRYTVTC